MSDDISPGDRSADEKLQKLIEDAARRILTAPTQPERIKAAHEVAALIGYTTDALRKFARGRKDGAP